MFDKRYTQIELNCEKSIVHFAEEMIIIDHVFSVAIHKS